MMFLPFLVNPAVALPLDTARVVAQGLGLTNVMVGSPKIFGTLDKIYSDDLMNQFILVVDEVPGKIDSIYLEERSNYLYLEIPGKKSAHSIIAAYNISKEAWSKFAKTEHLKNKNSNIAKNILNLVLPTSAEAQPAECVNNAVTGAVTKDKTGLHHFLSNGFMAMTVGCIQGLMKGAVDGTVGAAKGALSSIKTLFTQPKKFMDEMVQSILQLKDFILNIDTHLTQAVAALKLLPNEVRAEILCAFLGSIGAQSLIAIFVTKKIPKDLFTRLATFSKQLLGIEKLLVYLSKAKAIKSIPKAFYSKLARGKVPQTQLDDIQTLSKHGFHKNALGVVNCAL